MDKYTFSTQNNKAYYYNTIPDFIHDDSNSIVGQLVRHSVNQTFEVNQDTFVAWEKQISELKSKLSQCGIDGDIIFEYDIIRLGKRIDVILLIRHMVFSLEFKNGKQVFTAQDAQQAEDYAIDIKNFHKESENLYVCPILIATAAQTYPYLQSRACYPDKQIHLQRENIHTLFPKVIEISKKYGCDDRIDFETWFNSPYYPTPTIIAAAIEAYNTHNLSEIAHSEAGQTNINECEARINEVIAYAKENKKKCVCFVTGVPGAGKTLVGLDVVAKNLGKGENNLSVYLSGNGPLVEVLREALKKSAKANKQYNKETEAAINALIQSSFAFKNDNAKRSDPTAENILIFDEAQRVWDQEKMTRKHKDPLLSISEPHLLFKIMNRHNDWAVMICLVGLGQDIYDGEVGINEWFRCGIEDFEKWELFYSPEIFSQVEDKNINAEMISACERCHKMAGLHLRTSIRSFRTDKQCQFIGSLLDNDPEFKVQGLEIDWAVVCWDADLRRNKQSNDWDYYSFRGTKWNHRNKPEERRYLLNSYRVLLTRARQGMVIFIPIGVDLIEDSTRNKEYYDDIYKYLKSCGIKEIEVSN